jgi:hypothetical protein
MPTVFPALQNRVVALQTTVSSDLLGFVKESGMTEISQGPTPRATRGFAAMSPERQRQIASLGGRAAHQSGHAHEFTSAEARIAGKKRHERQPAPDA